MLGRIPKAVTDALFPRVCSACDRFLEPGGSMETEHPDGSHDLTGGTVFSRVMSPFLCENCREQFVPIVPPVCPICGLQFVSRIGDDHRCGDCIQQEKPFLAARAFGQYGGVLMTLIHAYKYRGRIQLARPLGNLLYLEFCRHYAEAGIDCIIPVPLHRSKLRKRGFNQVLLMLDKWTEKFHESNPSVWSVPVVADVLVRIRNTESQTGLGKKARRENIRKAFSIADPSRITGRRILLVDDVYTTGATLEECAGILIRAGAAGVFVLTLARAM